MNIALTIATIPADRTLLASGGPLQIPHVAYSAQRVTGVAGQALDGLSGGSTCPMVRRDNAHWAVVSDFRVGWLAVRPSIRQLFA